MSDFSALIERANVIRSAYAKLEAKRYGDSWSGQDLAMGFVGDVGDLLKLIMAVEGKRHIPEAQAKLEHELADCLWSIIVLAQVYKVDLEAAFLKTMNELEASIQQNLD